MQPCVVCFEVLNFLFDIAESGMISVLKRHNDLHTVGPALARGWCMHKWCCPQHSTTVPHWAAVCVWGQSTRPSPLRLFQRVAMQVTTQFLVHRARKRAMVVDERTSNTAAWKLLMCCEQSDNEHVSQIVRQAGTNSARTNTKKRWRFNIQGQD